MDLARLAAWRASGQLSHFLIAPTDNGGSSSGGGGGGGGASRASIARRLRRAARVLLRAADLLDHDDAYASASEIVGRGGSGGGGGWSGGWCGARSGYEDDYEDIDGESVDDTARPAVTFDSSSSSYYSALSPAPRPLSSPHRRVQQQQEEEEGRSWREWLEAAAFVYGWQLAGAVHLCGHWAMAALQGVPAEVRLPWQRFMPLYGWAWNLFQVGWWMGWWVGRSQICFIIDGLVDWDD